MRTYRVSGTIDDRSAGRVVQAIKSKISGEVTVRVDGSAGEVRVDSSADPQVVSFAIEGEGFPVDSVSGEQSHSDLGAAGGG